MGEHRYNPVAVANAAPKQTVTALDLGEEAALLGVQIRPVIDTATSELVIMLEMVGGHNSRILGAFVPKHVPVGELARLPLANVRRVLKGAAPPAEEVPATSSVEPPAAVPPEPSPLVLVREP